MRNGTVLKATAKIVKESSTVHVPKKAVMLERHDPISRFDDIKEWVVFEVQGVDDKHPPLSPRSSRRTL
jgi:hypothetical protein